MRGNYAKASRLLRPLAEQGNTDAQVRLTLIAGAAYTKGDYATAVRLVRPRPLTRSPQLAPEPSAPNSHTVPCLLRHAPLQRRVAMAPATGSAPASEAAAESSIPSMSGALGAHSPRVCHICNHLRGILVYR